MSSERTLSIIKPDAVAESAIGKIISIFEENGLKIDAMSMLSLSVERAQGFYAEHSQRPFFADLVDFMTSGPIVVMVLAGQDAIMKNRKLMGATDPAKADAGTIRAEFASSIERNAVHGSDSAQAAAREIDFFFPSRE